jgi:nicotinamide-nucleotide amidase
MNAIILSVGDELVLGQTVDTNSAWLSEQLAAVGCNVIGHATVPDDQLALERAIRDAGARCDFLVISGGIGPTEDDLTRHALAAVLHEPLELDRQALAQLEAFFQKVGRKMPQTNRIQAMIPRGVKRIDNTAGTAPGMDAAYQTGDLKTTCRIFVMPGVPKEMKIMFARDVLPHIRSASNGAVILSRTLHTFGLGESSIAEKLGDLMNRRHNPSVGTTVSGGIVSLRVNARFSSLVEAQRRLEETAAACRTALGDLIFGQDDESLPMIVSRLLKASDKPLTITTAESCTGGLLAKMLTDLPGSSAYFKQGWITYSNQAKYDRLGVSMEILNLNGAVSEPVVEAMATHARRLAKADFALSISGIAGPEGGSAAKPVGTVCIGMAEVDPADPSRSLVQKRTFHFTGDREMIRDRAAKMALTMLRFRLMGKRLDKLLER